MFIFGSYRGQRLTVEVPTGMTILELKEKIKVLLGISKDFYRHDKKVLALTYAGSELQDTWVFSDLGISPGANIKIKLKEEVKPVLYIHCSHNQETISVYEDISIAHMKLDQIRSIASRLTGLPVGIFRLTTQDGREMFDANRLDDYGVDLGHTIMLENWDGWSDFLNLAIMGFTQQVLSQLVGEEAVVRYKMRVALFIASHFGHVDLARYLLKMGCRSDEPTGYHPARAWCQDDGHKDSRKCPVHEATLCGQLAVLKLFVYFDITCLKAKDSDHLEPINIALRNKIKYCAMFLVSKQWSKINITKTFAVRLATYALLKAWCKRAKERALLKYGVAKSSLKQRTFYSGAMVHHGILVDGYSKSHMNGKTKAILQKEEKMVKEEHNNSSRNFVSQEETSREDPEYYFKTLITLHSMKNQPRGHVNFPSKWNRVISRAGSVDFTTEQSDITNSAIKKNSNTFFSSRNSKLKLSKSEVTKLPPLQIQSNVSQRPEAQRELRNFNSHAKKINLTGLSKEPHYKTMSTSQIPKQIKQSTGTVAETGCDHVRSVAGSDHLTTSVASLISVTSLNNDVFSEDEFKAGRNHIKKRKGRLSDVLLVTKVKSNEGGIPLPLISNEQERRPFFYHQGQRENVLVESTMGLVSKYKGDTSRERAIKSLTLAKTFTRKPWLGQVRVALTLTNNSLKRSMLTVSQY